MPAKKPRFRSKGQARRSTAVAERRGVVLYSRGAWGSRRWPAGRRYAGARPLGGVQSAALTAIATGMSIIATLDGNRS